MGRPSHRRRGARAHDARADRLLRRAARALPRRVVPPRGHRLPARVGGVGGQAPPRLHRDRRGRAAAHARAAEPPRPRRGAQRLPRAVVARRGVDARVGRRRVHGRAARAHLRRPGPRRSRRRGARPRVRPRHVAARPGRRPRGRRGRPRGPGRGRLRGIRGHRHAGDRGGVHRRSGGVELADPQLPRLLARGLGRRTRPARLPAGVGVRRALRAHPQGDGHARRRGRVRARRRRAASSCARARSCSRRA